MKQTLENGQSSATINERPKGLNLRTMEYCLTQEIDASTVASRLDATIMDLSGLAVESDFLNKDELTRRLDELFFLRDLFIRVSLDNGMPPAIYGATYRFALLDEEGGEE